MFTASTVPMRDLKSWTSHTLFPSGSVIIDSGAHHVLSRRESGGRLLAAGVIGIIGAFASGQAVRIVIHRKPDGSTSPHDVDGTEHPVPRLDDLETARPMTLTLFAASSMNSSETPESLTRSASSTGLAEDLTPTKTLEHASEDDVVLVEKTEVDESKLVEVGRGLANYNSAQITRVKGLNRYVHLCPRSARAEHPVAPTLHKCWAMPILNMWSKTSLSEYLHREFPCSVLQFGCGSMYCTNGFRE